VARALSEVTSEYVNEPLLPFAAMEIRLVPFALTAFFAAAIAEDLLALKLDLAEAKTVSLAEPDEPDSPTALTP
jgi:hypothetical protein